MLLKNPNEYFIYLLKVKNYLKNSVKKLNLNYTFQLKKKSKISKNLNKYIEIVEMMIFIKQFTMLKDA